MCQLSIVFITYNRKNELLRAIESCLPGLSDDMEVVIVDNASTDGTEDMVAERFPSIRYYKSESNLGVAGGRNKAFEICTGRYAFFLDDDAIVVSKDFFNQILDFMTGHPNVAAASVDVQEPLTGKNLNSMYCFYDKREELHYILSYCGCAHILDCSFFNKEGVLYPDGLMFGSEELYASLSIWNSGKKVVWLNDLRVNHMPSKINRYDGKIRKFNLIVNQYLIKKMKYPRLVLPLAKLAYELHKIKNGLTGKKWSAQSKELFAERYDKKYRQPIKLTCWFWMLRKFGWRVVI